MIQFNRVSKSARKYDAHIRILFEIVTFIKISRSYLNCYYTVMNFSSNLTIGLKQTQSIDNTALPPLCTQIATFVLNRSRGCAYEIYSIIRNFPYIFFI